MSKTKGVSEKAQANVDDEPDDWYVSFLAFEKSSWASSFQASASCLHLDELDKMTPC